MLFSILSLVLTVLFVVFIFWCISSFWAWLADSSDHCTHWKDVVQCLDIP